MSQARRHRALRQSVEPYLDGEADPAAAGAIRRHLAECWTCSQDAEWLSLIKAALARVGERRPPELAAARLTRYASSLSSGQ